MARRAEQSRARSLGSRPSRWARLVPAAALLAAASLSCGGARDPGSRLRTLFPAQAARVLEGQPFSRMPGGFALRAPASPDPVKAAEASLAARGGLRLELPAEGPGAAVLSLPGGFTVEVRERGLAGPGRAVEGAVAYAREGGASYWAAGEAGYEEWLLVDGAGAEPVARWEVQGGTLRQAGEAVEIVDAAGAARLRVAAPRAFDGSGKPARCWLAVEGQVLALRTDARGPALVDPLWTVTAATSTPRAYHTATLLSTGKVLVAGGWGSAGLLASAELYDPAAGTWTPTGSLGTARADHAATLLPSGKVLVAGGLGAAGPLASAELYDPAAGTWTATGSLGAAREYPTATLLGSGKLLVAGGWNGGPLASAELYDPAAGTWAAAGPLGTARSYHAAALLPSGKVLVAGGLGAAGALASAELYDPAAGTWAATGPLGTARFYHSATLLPSGKVLAAGGYADGVYLGSAELYDPAAGTWTRTAGALGTARGYHVAALLPSGEVLVAGGYGAGGPLASAELYDPAADAWSSTTGALGEARYDATATVLPTGRALVSGGYGATGVLASAELYDPAAGSWSPTGALATAREDHTATLLPSGKVLVAGGTDGTAPFASAELLDPATGLWSPTGPLGTARHGHTATLLAFGKVLVVGGSSGAASLASAELYDPATGAWTAMAGLGDGMDRAYHTATLLPSGGVLVAGGMGSAGAATGGAIASVQLYAPAPGGIGSWITTASLLAARYRHTATLLPSGKVLVAGGNGVTATAATTAEVYDPAAAAWTATGSLTQGRYDHAATLLPSGKVLVSGGFGADGSALQLAELYDPAPGSWTPTTAGTARGYHAGTLLPSGKALLSGGAGATGAVSSAELFDEGRGAQAAWTPTLSSAPAWAIAGTPVSLGGTLFTGVSEGSGGGFQCSAANHPVVQLVRQDGGPGAYATVTAYTPTSATAALPLSLQMGPHWLRVVVNGAPSTALPLTVYVPLVVSPDSLEVPPSTSQTLTAAGGSGLGLAWSLATNASGGSVVAAPGGAQATYTSGSVHGVKDIIQVTDSLGLVATVGAVVTTGVTISPAVASVAPRDSLPLTASSDAGTTFTWSIRTNGSRGATITPAGVYTAGPVGDVMDLVQVADALGTTATRQISVGPGVSISPASASVAPGGTLSLTASGGTGTGFSWSFQTNASGGTIVPSADSATAVFTAGATGDVIDEVQAVDSLGNTATASLAVRRPSSASSKSGCGCGAGGDATSLLALGVGALLRRRRKGARGA